MTDREIFRRRVHRSWLDTCRYVLPALGASLVEFGWGGALGADPNWNMAMSRVVHLSVVHDDGSNDVGYGLLITGDNKRMGIVTADHVLRGQSWNLGPTTVTVQFVNTTGQLDQAGKQVVYTNITELNDPTHDIGYFEITYDADDDGFPLETSVEIQDKNTYEYVSDTAPFYIPTTEGKYNSTSDNGLLYFDSMDVETGASGGAIFDKEGFAAIIL
jgi:hypothetical protein